MQNKITLFQEQKYILDQIAQTMEELVLSIENKQDSMEPKWPCPLIPTAVLPTLYVGPYYWWKFFESFKELKQKDYTHYEIAKLFKYPSIIARLIHGNYAKRLTGLSKNEEIRIVLLIYELIACLKNDPLCIEHKNILHNTNQIQQILDKIKFVNFKTISKNFQKELSLIEGKLFSYTEFIYMLNHNLGHEFHGPYQLDSQHSLLIKEYHDLRPEFWPETKKFIHDKINIYYIYKHKNIDISIDWHNRVIISKPLINNVVKYYIEVDGISQNSFSKLGQLHSSLDEIFTKLIHKASRMDSREAIKKMAEVYFYNIKPLSDELGVDWRPPKELYQQIQKGKLTRVLQRRLELFKKTKRNAKGISKFYDVRIDI